MGDVTSNSAVLHSSQRELSNAPEITFPDAREAKSLRTPLGAVGLWAKDGGWSLIHIMSMNEYEYARRETLSTLDSRAEYS